MWRSPAVLFPRAMLRPKETRRRRDTASRNVSEDWQTAFGTRFTHSVKHQKECGSVTPAPGSENSLVFVSAQTRSCCIILGRSLYSPTLQFLHQYIWGKKTKTNSDMTTFHLLLKKKKKIGQRIEFLNISLEECHSRTVCCLRELKMICLTHNVWGHAF